METKLVVVGGKANRQEIRLKLPATLGRGKDADLTVAHPLVSRHHCRLEEVDGALVLRDNNSTNGTFVGKTRITEVILKPGDQFTVGPLTFKAEYQHAGAFPKLGKPSQEDEADDELGLPQSAEQRDSDLDFTVAFDQKEAAKAKPAAKPAAAKGPTKAKGAPAETKPAAKPAEKKPPPTAKTKSEPVQPPAAAVESAGDDDGMDWLLDSGPSAPTAEPEPLADLGFDDEPIASAAPAEVEPAEEEEVDSLPLPAAEEAAAALDWLEEPAAGASAEPVADLGFDDEPIASAAPAEVEPAEEEEVDSLPLPAAEEAAAALDWLEEPAAGASAEPVADLGFDDEPIAAAAPAEVEPAEEEEVDSLPLPAAEEAAAALDWLEEPAAGASAEPLADLGFDDEPIASAAPAEVEPAEEEEVDSLPLPAAEEAAAALDWLEEPAAGASAEPVADLGFDDEPIAAAAPAEVEPAEEEEVDSLPLPAAEEAAAALDWLAEPAAAGTSAEPLADLGFDDEPIASAAPAEVEPAEEEEVDSLPLPAAEEAAAALDWLAEPAAGTSAEPLADLGFDEEPMVVEKADEVTLPATDAEADVFDWLDESAASAPPAEAEPVADVEFDEIPVAAEPLIEDAAPAEPLADLGITEEPVAAEALPEAADQITFPVAEADADFADWLDEPGPKAAHSEVGSLESPGFDEEPVPAEPLADLGVDEQPLAAEAMSEEPDLITLPTAESEADVFDWLDESAASAPPAEAEPVADVEFDEIPVAAEPLIEDAAPAEPLADLGITEEPVAAEALPEAADQITFPVAEADADFADWLDEPGPKAAHSEVESLESLSIDEEPVPAEPLADLDIATEPVGAVEFDEIPVAAEPLFEDAAPVPAEPLADLGMDEQPLAAEALPEVADQIPLPVAESDADFMDWLGESEPKAAHSEVESLESLSIDEEPVPAEPLADLDIATEPVGAVEFDEIPVAAEPLFEDAAPVPAEPLADLGMDEQPLAADALPEVADQIPLPVAESDADFMDWLGESEPKAAHSEVESLESLSIDEEPVPAEPLADLGMDEQPLAADALPEVADQITLPVAESDADFMDWLGESEPKAAHSEVESLESLSIDEEPVPAEPLADLDIATEPVGAVDFDEIPVAAEPLFEDAAPVPAEPLADLGMDEQPLAAEALPEPADQIPLPVAESDADFMDWLGESEPKAAHSEVESLESLSIDEEPVPAEPLADLGMDEQPIAAEALPEVADQITLPVAESDADFMDWLGEPAGSAPQAASEPVDDVEFDEIPVAAEPLGEDAPAEPAALAPPTAESDADFVDWLDEPEPKAAHSEVESLESMSFDEEPVPAEALPEAAVLEEPPAETARAEEADLIASPTADAEAGMLDWLDEPAAGDELPGGDPFAESDLDEEPVAAESFDALPGIPDAESNAPPPAEADEMTSFWPGETSSADPQIDDQPSDEMDFDFNNEADADAELGGLPPAIDEPMFLDENTVDAPPTIPDESLDLEMDFGAEQQAADLDATEMFVASDEATQQPAVAEPAGFSDDDALDSLGVPGEAFETAEAKELEEAVEFDFLAGDAPTPAATSEIEALETPKSLPPVSHKSTERGDVAAGKPAKKGWWPFGKSKKEKPEKKPKPEPKGQKSTAPKEPEQIPLAAAECMPLASPEEFAAPVAPQAAADDDGTPDFSFADSGHDAPAKSGGDDDLEDFFQDLGLK